MVELIGRDSELAELNSIYELRKFKCCAIVGRHRIGKSSLIEKFVEDKKHIYFEFLKGLPEVNLRHMELVIGGYLGEEISFRDFMEAFRALSNITKKEDVVIVFDEFAYALSYDSFSSLTKNLLDRDIYGSFLIISGSVIKMMESEIGDYSKPLYGRTQRMNIAGISLKDSVAFHPRMPKIDILRLHVLTGGSPFYLADTPADSLQEYMDRYVIPERAMFHYEGEQIITREIDNPVKCIHILDAMAAGRNEIRLICDYARIDDTSCRKYLGNLMELGVVEKMHPMCGCPEKPVRYRIKDPMVAIHFKIIRGMPMRSKLGFDAYSLQIYTELGRLFESYCSDLIVGSYMVTDIGSWIDRIPSDDGTSNELTYIDVVAEATDGKNRVELFVECKLKNSAVGFETLNDLDRKLNFVHGKRNYRRVLISASGFQQDLYDHAELAKDLILIDCDCLFGERQMPPL